MGKKIIITFIAVIAILLLWFNQMNRSNSEEEINITSVDAVEFSKLMENKETFLLDVHIPEQTHIPGTDAFIPYNEISQNVDQLPENKDAQILVYCRSGSMSREAAYELSQMGYTNVIDLAGGINAYKEENVSVEISPKTQDLGTVIYGDVPTTEFKLTNFTPAELNITRVSTSCSCTSAEVSKLSLEPYETATVKVSFDPAVHGDDTDVGDITRTIYIDTDNPDFTQVTATITANVVKQ